MKEINESITKTPLKYVLHGVNCAGKMGAGAALAIRKKWPDVYDGYMEMIEEAVEAQVDPLGMASASFVDDGTVIINLFTQESYGRSGKKYANYSALVRSLDESFKDYIPLEAKKVAITRIGCSLGGLDWNFVKEILLEFEEKHQMEFWVYGGN